VLKLNVKVGDTVAEGQAVAVLEAMKMENDIAAPSAGTVASVNVSVGDSINSGDVLVTLN
ncbi:MAG: biotin/lipoyl-containing protein, partial [Clostridia bacterium]|nr:biotin/lipoyl-containing protein [Clostridia bacterium]